MTADLFDLPEAQPTAGTAEEISPGAVFLPGFALDVAPALLEAARTVARAAPFQQMVTPGGGRMSVAMTSCGEMGWISDREGYRYTRICPVTGQPWPAMPEVLRDIAIRATRAAGYPEPPLQSCLINCYRPGTRMSLHQDRNEKAADMPVVSVSLGVAATFLWGGLSRTAPVRKLRLAHGDVLVWGGPARFRFHGIAPLGRQFHPATGESRVNITFRRVLPTGAPG